MQGTRYANILLYLGTCVSTRCNHGIIEILFENIENWAKRSHSLYSIRFVSENEINKHLIWLRSYAISQVSNLFASSRTNVQKLFLTVGLLPQCENIYFLHTQTK